VVGPQTFFDNATNGVGSFTDPGELPAMITAGGENALLIGLDTTGDVDIGGFTQAELTLLDEQTVMGGGTGLRVWGVQSGQTAVFHAPGSPATLANAQVPGLTLAHSNTIEGLGFTNMGTALWLPLDAESTMADIYNNDFWNVWDSAVRVDMLNDSELTLYLTDNDFLESGTGLSLYADDTFNIEVEAHGNSFVLMGAGLAHNLFPDGSGPSSFALNASGNTFQTGTFGIFSNAFVSGVNGPEAYTHTANISNNDFVDIEEADYFLTVTGAAVPNLPGEVDVDVAVQGNRSVWGYYPIYVWVDDIPDGHVGIEVVDNQILDAYSEAIDIGISDGPDVDATIARNEISWGGNVDGGIAIELYIDDSSDEDGHVLTISDNIIDGSYYEAIYVDVNDGLATDLTIASNEITNTYDEGILVEFEDVGDGTDEGNKIAIEGNTLENTYDDAIYVDVDSGSDDTALTIADNNISFVEDDEGIYVEFDGVGHADGNTITIQRNTLEFTSSYAIDVEVDASYDTAVAIADNSLSFIDDSGIYVDVTTSGHDVGNAIAIDRNTLEFVNGDGIEVYAADNYDTTLAMAGNALSNINGDGIYVDFDENGAPGPVGNMITINGGNTIAFADGDGIKIGVDGFAAGDTEVAVADNTVEHVEGDGIEIDFDGVVDGVLTVRNNVVDGSDADGIDINLDDDLIGGSDGNEVTIASNLVSNSLGDGVYVFINDNSNLNEIAIRSNTISHSEDDGVYVWVNDVSDGNQVTIASNQITDSYSDGVDVWVNGSELNLFTIENNRISDTVMWDGISVWVNDVLSDANEFTISNNTLRGLGDDGIWVGVDDFADNNLVTIGGNNIDSAFDDGIDIDGNANLVDPTVLSSEINGADRNNTVTNFGGVDAEFTGNLTGQLLVNGTLVP
jgi:hypothetical protein